jgi:hypothetical protein
MRRSRRLLAGARNGHPAVGALVVDLGGGRGVSDVWVSFAPEVTPQSAMIHGHYVSDPQFGAIKGGESDTHDEAVVLLDQAAAGITPVRLPRLNLLDTLKLKGQTITTVGYGTTRSGKTGGPHAFGFDGVRRSATQSFLSLQPAWLNLSMNPSTGNGGGCYGDSDGPHFLGGSDSNLLVSTTVTGDAVCRATDKTYRLDTKSARDFLSQYVTLP